MPSDSFYWPGDIIRRTLILDQDATKVAPYKVKRNGILDPGATSRVTITGSGREWLVSHTFPSGYGPGDEVEILVMVTDSTGEFPVSVAAVRLARVEVVVPPKEPSDCRDSLTRFRQDHPDPKKVAFLIMQFRSTPVHERIVTEIRGTLAEVGITAVRADDKEYHDNLYANVRTYMHGCGWGIAVFERVQSDDFNPNVSLEVGYMYGLGKNVCLLKDRTLRTLHSDLVGQLYREFDTYDVHGTLPISLRGWMRDKELIK